MEPLRTEMVCFKCKAKFNAKSSSDQYLVTIDDYVDLILNMVFGFKNEEHFNYEII